MAKIALCSTPEQQQDLINLGIEMSRAYDVSLNFFDFVDTTTILDPIPHVDRRTWISTQDGVVLGETVESGNMFISMGGVLHIESRDKGFFSFKYKTLTAQQLSDRKTIESAILDVSLQGATLGNGERYALTVVQNIAGTKSLRIFKTVGAANTEVCNYTIEQINPSVELETLTIPEIYASGITAVVTIDWSKVSGSFLSMYAPGWWIKHNYINITPGVVYNEIQTSKRNLHLLTRNKKIQGSTFPNSGYINASTGLVQANSSYVYSDYYLIDEGDLIELHNFGGSANAIKCQFVDQAFKPLATGHLISVNTSLVGYGPADVYAVRFCYLKFNSGVTIYPEAFVILKDEWTRRQSKILSNKEDFIIENGATISNGLINIASDGTWKKYLTKYVETYIELIKIFASFRITALSAGTIDVGIGKWNSSTYGFAELRMTETNIELWVLNKDVTGDKLVYSFAHGLAIAIDGEITMSIDKKADSVDIEVSDGTTTATQTILKYGDPVIADVDVFALMWGMPYLSVINGNITVKDLFIASSYNFNPKLGIWGDSFIEGSTMLEFGLDNRYCAKIAAKIGSTDCNIFGKGGMRIDSDWVQNFIYENDWFRPKYCLIALGTNNADFAVYQDLIETAISLVKLRGQIPILVTVTPRPDVAPSTAYADFRVAANAWIRTTANEIFVDVAKAVTVPGDESTWKTGYVLADNTHPSVIGHQAIFNRFKIDAPFLVNL